MVLILVQNVNKDDFCFDCKCDDDVNEVTQLATTIHNKRIQLTRLSNHIKQLALYGPIREVKIGLNRDQVMEMGNKSKLGDIDDPLLKRIGKPPSSISQINTLNKTADDVLAYISNKQAELRVSLTLDKINEHINNCRGAIMIAYPMNLPNHDPVMTCLNNEEDFSNEEDSKYVLDISKSCLWFAGKKLLREHKLSKYVGNNENCTIKVKLQHKNKSAPQRIIDEDSRRQMMKLYYKKEQEKEFNADDDDYSFSPWANQRIINTITWIW